MTIESTGHIEGQYLVDYEPGDATRYTMSIVRAHWAAFAPHLGAHELPYWQIAVWTGSGEGNGTMLAEAGDYGTLYQSRDFLIEQLRCSTYSAGVFSIMIHGCLGSHELNVAREGLAHFRESSRTGFVDPDATERLRE